MDYAVHNVPSYQHLQDSPSPSHLGSKNSPTHHAGGNAGWSVGAGKPTKNEKGAPKGMDM